MSNIVRPVVGAAADVVKSVAKDVGHSAHIALGGGYRDAAVAKGVKSQYILRGIKDPKSLVKATRPKGSPLASRLPNVAQPVETKAARRTEINNLQKERKKAIVKTIGYGAAGTYGAVKVKDKITGSDEPQQYY